MCWFTPQRPVAATAGPAPARSQHLHQGLPCGWQGLLQGLPGALSGSWRWHSVPGTPIWDAGIPSTSLTQPPVPPTLLIYFLPTNESHLLFMQFVGKVLFKKDHLCNRWPKRNTATEFISIELFEQPLVMNNWMTARLGKGHTSVIDRVSRPNSNSRVTMRGFLQTSRNVRQAPTATRGQQWKTEAAKEKSGLPPLHF